MTATAEAAPPCPTIDPRPKPLIGVDELETPFWARRHEAAARSGTWAAARAAPRTAAVLVCWSWRAAPRLTVAAVALHLATAVVTALGLLATAPAFASLLNVAATPQRVLEAAPALAVVIGAAVLHRLLTTAVGAVQAELIPRVDQRVQDELFAGLVDVDLVAFDDPDFTTLVERVSTETLITIRFGATLLADVVSALVVVIAAVTAAAVLHPLLAPLVLLSALPRAWSVLRCAQVQMAATVRMNSGFHRRDVTGRLIAGREHAAEIRAFGAQPILLREHRRIAADLTRDAVDTGRRRTLLTAAGHALSALTAMAGYLLLGLLLHTGALPLALAATAVLALRTAARSVDSGVHAVNQLLEVGLHTDLYQECIAAVGRGRRAPARLAPEQGPARIDLDRVGFRYPGQVHDSLHEVTLTLRRGEVVALVGENGSGKTTLAKLLAGLYLPTSGTVRWDDHDIRHLDQSRMWDQVAMVMQEPLRWPATAENNIRIGRLDRPDPGDLAFNVAAVRSGAHAVLADLPAGPGTVLSRQFHGGRDLSGGQWQRISVARGLYRDGALVIADEPTAAMDARAEHDAFTALRSMSAASAGHVGRITVLITHRLANVRHADRIVVLSDGRIIETGTHTELMARGGTYRELFALQAQAYTSEGTPA